MSRPNPELFQFNLEAEAFVNTRGETLTEEMRGRAVDVQKLQLGPWFFLKVVWA